MEPVDKALALVAEFRKLNVEIPATQMAVFLYVAKGGEINFRDVEKYIDMTQATTSRAIGALSGLTIHTSDGDKPGHGLVEFYENPFNRRAKVIRLTPKGKQLWLKLQEILNG